MVPWILHGIQKLRFWRFGLVWSFHLWYFNDYCVQLQLASVKNDSMSNDFRRRNSSLELKDRFPDFCSKIHWYWLVSNQRCRITVYNACTIYHQALLEQEAARRRLHEENQVGMIMILNLSTHFESPEKNMRTLNRTTWCWVWHKSGRHWQDLESIRMLILKIMTKNAVHD